MVITHHGGQCFKVTFGDVSLVFDPVSKGATLPPVRFGADIALVSSNHPNYNGVDEVTYGDKKPFAILGPGEYERAGITVQGFLSKGPNDSINTIYAVDLEDMTIVHLGALATTDIPPEAREALDDIDVLFVPVGGEGVLTPAQAHELTVALEPHVVVPMHWSGMGTPKALDSYLKEEGGSAEKTDKLTLKKKDVLTRDGDIIVVQP